MRSSSAPDSCHFSSKSGVSITHEQTINCRQIYEMAGSVPKKRKENASNVKRKIVFFHQAKLLEILSQLGSVYEVRVIDSSDSLRTEGELFFLFQSSDWWLRTLDTDLKNNSLSSICRWWDYFDCNLFRIRTWN